MKTSYSTDPTVLALLSRLPADGPAAARAAELVRTHERCADQAVGELPSLPEATTSECAELVELYRLGLLTELADLSAERYLTAIDAGDFDTISDMWARAEVDAGMAEQLHALNAIRAAEGGVA